MISRQNEHDRIAEKVTDRGCPLPVGSVFAGRYRIERVITHGERKWTYLASDMKTHGHRQVALAVMEPGSHSAASQREVEMMGKVGSHDSIITLHDFDLDSPSPYLVYEFLPGDRLRDHCRDLQREDRPRSAQAILGELRDIERTADLGLLIAGGESASLEFKQTMRWDTQLQKRSTEVLRASLKTVCAFLNGRGGTLLIGVADMGEPKGLHDDLQDFSDKKTVDGVELKFRDALSKNVNPDPNQLVTLSFPYANGIQICRVDVNRSPRPVFLVAKSGPAEFFVRKGNASPPVTDVRQACEYVHDHWR